MFDEITEYSSDVEWLLQDKQAKENTILKVLVPEHFERTLRLAFLISLEPEEAILATCETFANALLSRHRYSSDQDVQEWLDQLLIATCQANISRGNSSLTGAKPEGDEPGNLGWDTDNEIALQLWRDLDALPLSDRLPYLLHSIFFFPAPQVARLFGLKEGAADARLAATRKQMLAGLNGKTGADPSLDEEMINACLSRSFQKRWEAENLVPEGPANMIAAIQSLVDEMRRERRRRVIFQEILLVAIVVVLVFTLVQVAVSLSADPSANRISPSLWSYLFTAWN